MLEGFPIRGTRPAGGKEKWKELRGWRVVGGVKLLKNDGPFGKFVKKGGTQERKRLMKKKPISK